MLHTFKKFRTAFGATFMIDICKQNTTRLFIRSQKNKQRITIKQTSLMTSSTNSFAASICSLVPSICTVLSLDVSPGGKCRGITCRIWDKDLYHDFITKIVYSKLFCVIKKTNNDSNLLLSIPWNVWKLQAVIPEYEHQSWLAYFLLFHLLCQ